MLIFKKLNRPLFSIPHRALYLKGTGLDKKNYNAELAEKSDRISYLENHVLSSETITESER